MSNQLTLPRIALASLLALASTFVAAGGPSAYAGGTPASGTVTDQLITQEGAGGAPSVGDYVGSSGALNTYYSYYIEVPAGLSQLTVDLFDADVGTNFRNNDQANERDRLRGSSYNTCVRYSLYRPDGTLAASRVVGPSSGCNVASSGTWQASDNRWRTLSTQSSPQRGHWELRVNMASSVTSGDDVNAFGIRAHDGTPGSGGTELNVYAHSFYIVGINDNGRSRSYALYPYVTAGCSASVKDFDWDAAGGNPYGSLSLTSRTGAFTHNNSTMSTNNSWQNVSFTGWTGDPLANDYGIWTSNIGIRDTGESNYGVFYLGNYAASAPPPTSQPQADTFRFYLPTDAGNAPVKPFVQQYVTHASGPNPPIMGITTTMRITVDVVNPTGALGSITFSGPTNLVTVNVPGGEVLYADNATATGTIVSQPAVGGSGNIAWNPGTVAPGATATLTYEVDVTPALPGWRIPVTGSPVSDGTTARYVDETGNTSQSRATYLFGPLCELTVTSSTGTAITLSSFSARSESAAPASPPHRSIWPQAALTAAGALSAGGLVLTARKRRSR